MPKQLEAMLARRHPGATVAVNGYEPVLGGFSRLTGRFNAVIDGEEQTMVVRGDPPAEMATCDTDRGQEWRLMSSLHAAGTVAMPQPLYFDDDGSELGTRAIIMSFVDGEVLLRLAAAGDHEALSLADRLVDLALDIHQVDVSTLPSAGLTKPADWDSYIDERIQRWRDIEANHSESDPFIRYLAAWLDKNRPPPAPLGLVHGDFQATNVLVQPDGRFVAVDWELTHIGDPREDLGWCRWNEVIQPPGLMARDEDRFCRRYAEASGLGSDVVNPQTVAYFSVLSAIGACQLALPTVASFAAGQNNSLVTAYVLGYISTFHEQFVQVPAAIEASVKEGHR